MAKAQVASFLAALTCFAFAIKGLQADPASGGSGTPFWDLYNMFTDWQHTHPDQTGDMVEMSLDNSSSKFPSVKALCPRHRVPACSCFLQ